MTDSTTPLTDRLGSYTARDALNLLGLLLLVAIVLPFVIYAVPQVVGASQSYVVLSGSMTPTFAPGDVVVVNDVPPARIQEGDVITFGGSATQPPTTHRVIAIERSNGHRIFRTKGDNNEDPDPSPVPASEVRGRVMELPAWLPGVFPSIFVIPYIGHVILFAQTTVGLVVLILGPFVLLAGSELLTFVRGFGGDDSADAGDSTDGEAGPSPASDSTPARSADSSTGASVDDAVADPSVAEGSESAEDGFTLSIRVLAVAVALLAAVGTYAGQRAYETRDPLTATLAAGAVVGCLLVLFMIVFGGESESESDSRPPATTAAEPLRTDGSTGFTDATPTERVVAGRPSSALRDWPRTEVDSPEALSEMAAERGTCVIRDAEAGEYVLFDDGVAYAAPPSGTEAKRPAVDDESASTDDSSDGDDATDADASDAPGEAAAPDGADGTQEVDR